MTSAKSSSFNDGIATRWAALIAALAYLFNPVAYAEFYAYPKLVVAHNIGATIANINIHGTMFAGMITCYFLNFVLCDVVMAWALYSLLAPVNRALSMLAAWFQLVYAAMGLVAVYNLVSVLHLLRIPEYQEVFGPRSCRHRFCCTSALFINSSTLPLFCLAFTSSLQGVSSQPPVISREFLE